MTGARAALIPGEDAVAFPVLSDERIEALRRFGRERTADAGQILYRQQDASFALVVVLKGRSRSSTITAARMSA